MHSINTCRYCQMSIEHQKNNPTKRFKSKLVPQSERLSYADKKLKARALAKID